MLCLLIYRSLNFSIPEIKCHILLSEDGEVIESKKLCKSLADFIIQTLILSTKCLYQTFIKVCF